MGLLTNSEDKSINEALQDEARKNPLFHATCEWLASRQRARKELGLGPLGLALKEKTGEEHNADDLMHILRFLADLGFGAVKTVSGKPALVNITTTLQSIGAVALGGSQLDSFKGKGVPQKFKPLANDKPYIRRPAAFTPVQDRTIETKPKEIQPSRRGYHVFLTIIVDGNPSVFPGPHNLNSEDLGEFLSNFSGLVRSMKKT